METQDEELIESLTPGDADLKSAYEKHLSLKARVDELERLEYLSDLQELECAESCPTTGANAKWVRANRPDCLKRG